MICPQCGNDYPDHYQFCSECSIMLSAPSQRKGRLWPPILILILMFAFGTVVYSLSKEEPTVSDTPWFSVTDGTLYFDETKYTGSAELEVPATVDGQTVTALGDYCFQYCDELTTVILPDTLVSIGENCFYDCEGLRGVKLPDSLLSIGSGAFYSCGALEAVYVPGSVAAIGEDAFEGCAKLRHIFFGSVSRKWSELYPERINPNAQVYLVDSSSPDGFYAP